MALTKLNPPEDLLSMTAAVRSTLEHIVEASLGEIKTSGTCMEAAILVLQGVSRWLPRYTATIRGGDGEGDGGFFGADGAHGHYWVEVDADGRCWVVDIAADQFGLPAVHVVATEEAATMYVPGNQSTVEEHLGETLEDIARMYAEASGAA